MSAPPSGCDMFQIDILVASFFGGKQCVIKRAQGGKPIPWNQPFSIQIVPSRKTVELKPNATFKIAEAASPVTIRLRACARSPKKPFANLDTPKSKPCKVRNNPS